MLNDLNQLKNAKVSHRILRPSYTKREKLNEPRAIILRIIDDILKNYAPSTPRHLCLLMASACLLCYTAYIDNEPRNQAFTMTEFETNENITD
jgi:hypothetical protein